MRVDVVPSSWKGKPLTSLAKEQSYDANFTYNNGNIFDELVTNSGLRVIADKSLNTVIVCNKNTLYAMDQCNHDGGTVRLLHSGRESFYGAGERGYSFNLLGDTLINYNKQNSYLLLYHQR